MHEQPGSGTNPELQHEESDVNVRSILWFLGIFIVFAVVVHIAFYYVFQGLAAYESSKSGAPMTLVETPQPRTPEPLLQTDPPGDMQKMIEEEDLILDHYGWVNREKGVVRIPVARAMELVVQRGLPVVNETAPQAATPAQAGSARLAPPAVPAPVPAAAAAGGATRSTRPSP